MDTCLKTISPMTRKKDSASSYVRSKTHLLYTWKHFFFYWFLNHKDLTHRQPPRHGWAWEHVTWMLADTVAACPSSSRGCWLTVLRAGNQEEEIGAGCWGTALWAQMSASIVGIFSSKPVVDSNTVHLFKAISNMSCLTSFKSYLTPRNSHEFTVRIKEENSQRERNYHFHFVHRCCL